MHDPVIEKDLRHFWRPATQMKDCEEFPPLLVDHALGSHLYLRDGTVLIDAISSWWCKSLGHCHPALKKAFIGQLDKFEHVIMADCCAEPVAELCSELAKLMPPLDRVFMAENGSVSVEIAMKMSMQYHIQTGHPERNLFTGLENAYHGETILALGAGDCDIYSKPFEHLVPILPKLRGLPYVADPAECTGKMDDDAWNRIEKQLEPISRKLAAIVFEPVLQGAGGMRTYHPDFLRRLRKWADANGVQLIADEILTGFGRTGKFFACQYAGIVPDYMTVSKGMMSGYAPMACVLTSSKVFDAFYADWSAGLAFMHSTTYSGYAPAAAVALAVLDVFRRENIVRNVAERSKILRGNMRKIAEETGALTNIRGVGYAIAADLIDPDTGKSFDPALRTGKRFFRNGVRNGILMRPIGDSVYFLPPLNTPVDVLEELAVRARKTLEETVKFNHEL